jgi:hypothetical protein
LLASKLEAASDRAASSMLGTLGRPGRRLSRREVEMLEPIFGGALAYEVVRVEDQNAPRPSALEQRR